VAMLLCSGVPLRWDADTMTMGVEFLGVVKWTIWERKKFQKQFEMYSEIRWKDYNVNDEFKK